MKIKQTQSTIPCKRNFKILSRVKNLKTAKLKKIAKLKNRQTVLPFIAVESAITKWL